MVVEVSRKEIFMEIVYETERLNLKVLDEGYADLVLEYYLRNKKFLEQWEPVKGEEFYTKEFHEELLKNELISMQNGNSVRL